MVGGPRKGDVVTVPVVRLDGKGLGVAELPDRTLHIRGGLPGSVVKARVGKRSKGRLFGYVEEVVTESSVAVPAPCPHVGSCGGCAFQGLAYTAQLEELRAQVARAVAGAGLEVDVPPVVGCDPPFRYRNKMDFTFSSRRWVLADEPDHAARDFALGMHVSGRFDKIVDIGSCELQFPEGDGLLASARAIAQDLGLDPWDVRSHRGLLRHLVLRKGFGTGEIMVNLVTSEDAPDRVRPWADALRERHPEVTTIVQNVNTRLASIAVGEREHVLFGPGTITEQVLGLRFLISANSFFQTNSRQAESLFQIVRDFVGARGDEVVWDLYCGAGALSLAVASAVREVIGFEIVDAAIADAQANAALNEIENARFISGDVLASLAPGRRPDAPAPDLCLVDPPRAGLHPKVLRGLRELAPPRIVWVSCNVGVAAPQIARLKDDGYRVEAVSAVDMFPHTPHVEVVFALRR